MPDVHRELASMMTELERHFGDLQDVEFTVQEGKLWLLQTRTGKRTATAALRVAVDMVDEGLCDEETAVLRVSPDQAGQLLHPQVDPSRPGRLLARVCRRLLGQSPVSSFSMLPRRSGAARTGKM